ncbi:Holliday junction branch migration protein RuvA [Dermatophilus congolensis]|uniref:Holliday junction branch migration complex subunit RuvA n=1 Tax=Dermatophilus congolensis TaxID=1863 RepID=A0AA46H089_9MICO|nr:Holliday junction branch migration protein RuvA [Dermatophilus congolensis]MBO3142776.1 Holliday junction branch migration protein RuvA [Dermatophilus congolensis]MBO3151769.1 Holliday junction branch migration protein RuvA [Dermatophilus congolensis]MBO3161228.1 Holliday junction branch migration protein RuvA [Dermatophilus congolensis]MBO3163051.1 Holliday junction branch migration protein RuvA [Dermatophilus congolensis]MBO3176604.1 Holliday junction branch migration protein RuvA [Dermat
MIASISGTVISAGLDQAVIVVGGVGLQVRLTPATAASLRVGEQAELATSLVVREDAWTLYGFADAQEKEIFEVAQSVSGVGPRMALAMLAVFTPARLATAISAGEVAALVKVPGIGKKSAERIILELREKMTALGLDENPHHEELAASSSDEPVWNDSVTEALMSLGWSAKQAEAALGRVAKTVDADAPVGVALKAALQELSR